MFSNCSAGLMSEEPACALDPFPPTVLFGDGVRLPGFAERVLDVQSRVGDVGETALRSFSRQRRSTWRIAGGVLAGSMDPSGSARRTAAMRLGPLPL